MHWVRHGRLLVAWSLVVCSVATAEAQVLRLPPRAFQPESNRQLTELGLETEFLGGFDDNLKTVPSQAFVPSESGYLGRAATRIRYRMVRETGSLEARGGGFVNRFSTVGTPSMGGDLTVRGRRELGRRTVMTLSQDVRSDPFFTLGAFDSLQQDDAGEGNGLESSSTNAAALSRSLVLGTATSIRHRWRPRTATSVSYRFRDRSYSERVRPDSRSHQAEVSAEHSISRASGLEVSYRFSDEEATDPLGSRQTVQNHGATIGLRYVKDLSRTRRVRLSGGVGPTVFETLDGVAQQPQRVRGTIGYGTAIVDLGQASWTLESSYRRTVSVLHGFGSPVRTYLTDAANVRLGGLLNDRAEVVFSGGYSNGRAGTDADTFDSYAVTGQVSVPVTDWWWTMVSYGHYRYTLSRAASVALVLAPRLQRNTLYVGFTLRTPLL